jgi:hypothetical protein
VALSRWKRGDHLQQLQVHHHHHYHHHHQQQQQQQDHHQQQQRRKRIMPLQGQVRPPGDP